jgi:hypothetical protein
MRLRERECIRSSKILYLILLEIFGDIQATFSPLRIKKDQTGIPDVWCHLRPKLRLHSRCGRGLQCLPKAFFLEYLPMGVFSMKKKGYQRHTLYK